jgi:hypothetical protein
VVVTYNSAVAVAVAVALPRLCEQLGAYAAGFALVRVVQHLLTGRLGRACWCRAAPSWTTCGGYRAP